MTHFYAQPYSIAHTGFYFDTLEEFETGMAQLNAAGCEEVEIQFIDGAPHLAALADTAHISQGDIALWFDVLEDLDHDETLQLSFLLACGYSLREALERYDEVSLYHGTARDYVQDLMEEITDIPELTAEHLITNPQEF